ncbi:MAG: hypothetical protein ACOCTM_02425 [Bacteroidota bacterium]
MRSIFAGDTPDFIISVKDKDGNVLDVEKEDTIVKNVGIVVYARFDPDKKVGRFALDNSDGNPGGYEDYDPIQTQDGSIKLILPADGTEKCVNEELIAQVTTILDVDGYDPPGQVLTGGNVICKVVPKQE